jgi:two-component system OmpR family response regulator/two-component system response regulator QseB
MRLLLVEDDEHIGRAVQTGLAQQGHAVDWVQDGVAAELAARDGEYDAVLLDLGLPRQDGMQVIASLRRDGFAAPILIITSRDEIRDRVQGLDSGADDFIVKPFDMEELGARLRAAHRRSVGRPQSVVVHGDIRVDPAARQVTRAGQPVPLTGREFMLLLHLLEHRGHVRTRTQLQESLYSWNSDIESNAIEVHVHNLRRKLGKDLIRTVHSQGYVIDQV